MGTGEIDLVKDQKRLGKTPRWVIPSATSLLKSIGSNSDVLTPKKGRDNTTSPCKGSSAAFMPWSTSPESTEMSITYSDSSCAEVGDGTKHSLRWLVVHAVSVRRAWIKSIVCLTTTNHRWPIIKIDLYAYFSKVANPRKTPAWILKNIGIQNIQETLPSRLRSLPRERKIPDSEGQRWIPGLKRVKCLSTKISHHSRRIGMRWANSTHAINHVDSTLNWQILEWLSKGQAHCRCLGRRVLTPSPWREFHPRDQSWVPQEKPPICAQNLTYTKGAVRRLMCIK